MTRPAGVRGETGLWESRLITEMHPNHWHGTAVNNYRIDGDGPMEYDVEDWVCQYHVDALAVFGRDDPYYVYDCEDQTCLDNADLDPEDDWRTPEACARRWGRND